MSQKISKNVLKEYMNQFMKNWPKLFNMVLMLETTNDFFDLGNNDLAR